MGGMLVRRDLIIGVTPFEEPNARLAVAVERAGALGVLSLGLDPEAARAAIRDAVQYRRGGTFGVRVGPGCPLTPTDLPDQVDTVIVALGSTWGPEANRTVLVEVSSLAEARQAVADGRADGLIAKGSESGGRVGQTTAFVLLQQLLADQAIDLPVWSAGGIGRHTAAAAIAGGAAGVVLDAQLALTTEAGLKPEIQAAIRAMDGSETTVVGGHRVYTRPDLPTPDPATVATRLGARDLRAQLLPIGQDGAMAKPLADQFVTAGALVIAIRESIAQHLAGAAATEPLSKNSTLARSRGLAYPIAQGPMTRVSDRAAFALAVATAGGLPFLALALMPGHEVRTLLEETAALLGTRPWGVGILGFVPAELRETQLAVVHDVRPPCALIAGGRPSQAAPLEAAGIDTFLHVPSPGLLDRFLRDGARKFVFEGLECGGHVGPRSSFALWEAQIERLLAFGAEPGNEHYFDGLHLLFAGGIHDERSAAMVAVAAAPLAQKGASIGVLMGTAYLFTDEAVASGAIVNGFQEAALGCDSTVLLETSPGHATRCVDTEYVQAFRDTKARLAATGATSQEIWAKLERLNLGRLRLASKGLRRANGTLETVNENDQRREGMVMIGEVATLRSTTTTVATLHAQVSEGATAFVAIRADELGVQPADPTTVDGSLTINGIRHNSKADPLDIAIVGMAGVFPAAEDTDRYWSNIVAGVDAVTEVPADRWDVATYYDPDGSGRTTPSRWGGFLPEIGFDALAYGLPPTSLAGIDPAQLLSLEVAARALADAGYATRPFDRQRTAVIFGAEAGTDLAGAYGFRALHQSYIGPLSPELDQHLPHLTEDSFPGVLSNVISGRIANRLDLGGANYTVDAACASSLAALDLACKELRAGTSDMVLCGGADVHNGVQDFLLFASVHALSPTGRCRTFDANADGIALGEAVACVVLKRLADAERDGDRVYAVVKAIAGSSDGRSLGLTAPRPEGQRRALERAYTAAGVSPSEVGMVEAHGTGTVVGDRTELATLTELFTAAGARPGSCALGSVKSQIGHTKCAAGLAGLIKVARALYSGVRAPTGQLSEPTGYWDRDTSPFYFDDSARPWGTKASDRYAGLSAFGFGGTNFHAVLGGYDGAPEPEQGLDEWPAELFVFHTAQQIDDLSRLLAANDAAGRPYHLRDLAWSVAADRGPAAAPVLVALVADDLDDLAVKLVAARSLESGRGVFAGSSDAQAPTVAFLFPGQGSQSPGMLSDLFVAFPRLQRFLALGDPSTMFPPAAFSRAESDRQMSAITDTRAAQPALGIAGLALHDLLAGLNVTPDLAGGHSYGELVALATAGAFDPRDLVSFSSLRGAAILDAAPAGAPGTMAAVSAGIDTVGQTLGLGTWGDPEVVIANHNAPKQVVISGPTGAVEAAVATLKAAGLSAKPIPVACAFHSHLVAGAAATLAEALTGIDVRTPAIPVWSNTTATPYPTDPDAIRGLLAGQVAAPVRFVEQVEAMYSAGARVFVEAGPGRVLTSLVGKILGDRPHLAVACDAPGENGVRRLLLALGALAAAGVPVDPSALYRGRHVRVATVAGIPRRPGWVVNGHLVRTAKGDYLPGGLRPAQRFQPAAMAPAPVVDCDAAVLEFLKGSRELVAAQRDVLLGYLGTGGKTLATFEAIGAGPVGSVALPEIVVPAPERNGASAAGAGGLPGAAAGPLTRAHVLDAVLAIVGERTGYPLDMLDPDLDLEADLSIDSIKRTEILGELAEQVGLTGAGGGALDESMVEELARLKTLNAIAGWVVEHASPGEADDPVPAAAAATPVLPPCGRFVVELDPLAPLPDPPDEPGRLAGRRYVIIDGGLGIGLELAERLERCGAGVRLLTPDQNELPQHLDTLDLADALIHLAAVDPEQPPVLPGAFSVIRQAAQRGVARLLVATGAGGQFGQDANAETASQLGGGLGLAGLIRTMRAEYPAIVSQLVDIDPKEQPGVIAEAIIRELHAPAPPAVIGYTRDRARHALRVTPAELDHVRSAPIHDIAAAAYAAGLGPDSVVVLTGGARGITSKVAVHLARVSGCHIELLGRTQAPTGDEDPATAGAPDAAAIRRALIAGGNRIPHQVEIATARVLALREVRSTLADLADAAASATYHEVDVRDAAAVRVVVDGIYARHGRIDGVIHGAGVLEDKRMSDKGMESFDRVYRTKVDGARNLADTLRPDLGFLVLFGSVSGVFGNRGQVDYAAANDALDTLARMWSGRFAGRVLALDWGPWAPHAAGAGMVSAELEREYARRGIGLIDVEDGIACLLRELAWGPRDVSQVVYMRNSAEAMTFCGDQRG